jgi:hypothetical protein
VVCVVNQHRKQQWVRRPQLAAACCSLVGLLEGLVIVTDGFNQSRIFARNDTDQTNPLSSK